MSADINILLDVMKRAADPNPAVSGPARAQFARAAIAEPVANAIFPGDIFSDLYTVEKRALGQDVRYPTRLIRPGREKDFSAYAVPSLGGLPHRLIDSEFIRVPTYENGNSIDIPLRSLEYGDVNLVKEALSVLASGIVMKMNNDAWKCAIRAAAGRNKVIYDKNVAPGQASMRLVSLMKTWFTRSAGNTSSVDNFEMTRLYLSPELRGSMLSWTHADADDFTRREVVTAADGNVGGLLGVEFKSLVELGVGSTFETFFETGLSGQLPTYTRASSETKVEILVGADLRPGKRDRFRMPVVKTPTVYEDDSRRRAGEVGYYCRFEYGTAVLDERVVLLGAA